MLLQPARVRRLRRKPQEVRGGLRRYLRDRPRDGLQGTLDRKPGRTPRRTRRTCRAGFRFGSWANRRFVERTRTPVQEARGRGVGCPPHISAEEERHTHREIREEE